MPYTHASLMCLKKMPCPLHLESNSADVQSSSVPSPEPAGAPALINRCDPAGARLQYQSCGCCLRATLLGCFDKNHTGNHLQQPSHRLVDTQRHVVLAARGLHSARLLDAHQPVAQLHRLAELTMLASAQLCLQTCRQRLTAALRCAALLLGRVYVMGTPVLALRHRRPSSIFNCLNIDYMYQFYQLSASPSGTLTRRRRSWGSGQTHHPRVLTLRLSSSPLSMFLTPLAAAQRCRHPCVSFARLTQQQSAITRKVHHRRFCTSTTLRPPPSPPCPVRTPACHWQSRVRLLPPLRCITPCAPRIPSPRRAFRIRFMYLDVPEPSKRAVRQITLPPMIGETSARLVEHVR